MNLKRPSLKGTSLGSRLRGSRLKGSELKAPEFLADFYYDLRDRRLLPVIALVVVAIAAVPFLLGDDGEEAPQLPAPAPEAGAADTAVAGASLTVVESTPGLRDYRKRLHGPPTDPFVQRYTGVPSTSKLKSIGLGGEGEGEASSGSEPVTSTESSSATEADGGSSPASSGGSPPASGGDGDGDGSGGGDVSQRYELVIDVHIARSEPTPGGGEKPGEAEVRRNVPVLTQLPGEKTPVVTTMGANFSKERLLFLVSHQVKAISGDYACVTRGEICELLEVELGMLLEYVYEPSGVRYAIKVTGVDAIPARKGRGLRSSRAALGRSHPEIAFDAHSFSK